MGQSGHRLRRRQNRHGRHFGLRLEALTDLVYVELPKVGRQLKAGETFGEIESVKAVSDLYSPVTGEVDRRTLRKSLDRLETFNADPYGEGWLVKIKLSSDAGLADLLDYKAYQKQCRRAALNKK